MPIINITKEILEINKENKTLRWLLWVYHGCRIEDIVRIDRKFGEWDCPKCAIDFKHDKIQKIKDILWSKK